MAKVSLSCFLTADFQVLSVDINDIDGFYVLVFFKKPAVLFSREPVFFVFEPFLFSTERISFFVDALCFPFIMIFLTREAIFLPSQKTIFSLIQTQSRVFVTKTIILVRFPGFLMYLFPVMTNFRPVCPVSDYVFCQVFFL